MIIMGAVIDEALQNRVEICVLGTSDLGGRGAVLRRPPARAKAPAQAAAGLAPGQRAEPPAAAKSVPPAEAEAEAEAKAAAAKAEQEEFGFGELESRGHFEKTDRNLFDGHDLDVPTYLRKGIKIVL